MPANVVKTKEDEKHWEEAKARAKEEGKADNYAYIMSIFQSMSGKKAAFTVPYAFAPVRPSGSRLAFQGLDIVLTKDSASARAASEGVYRGLLRGTTGTGGQPPVATYVGPNALSPLAMLVREADRRALVVGFDDEQAALRAYQAHRGPRGAGSFEYRAAAIGEVADWAAALKRV